MKALIGKHKKALIIIAVIVILAAVIGGWIYIKYPYWIKPISAEKLEEIKNNSYKKLMIVAHPDDEALWGGIHLLEDDYYVVCITNGKNNERADEFRNVLAASGNEGIILSYPDCVRGDRDEWDNVWDELESDIKNIIDIKDWELIVTHNPKGEYGHIHHILTDKIVTGICEEENITDILYYFGRYCKKAKLPENIDNMTACTEEQLKKKEELLKIYKSQEKTVEGLSHMNPYEEWISYDQWD